MDPPSLIAIICHQNWACSLSTRLLPQQPVVKARSPLLMVKSVQLQELDIKQPLFDIALELERIALEEDYFIERKLYPNVDFYSGIILSALGIPLNMFTVLFAVARTVGWVAQWMEMMDEADLRIARPRQLYIGAERRDYVPVEERT